ncbi:hypothetical protein ACIHCQ_37795 [Streptomyces sp. NPDC052236]|uniref:hypothetical protein n=1 Tax=Streptomyces sp. NPDC052236 TaxID=3365686 RepID=UPI0037D634F4
MAVTTINFDDLPAPVRTAIEAETGRQSHRADRRTDPMRGEQQSHFLSVVICLYQSLS